MKRVCNIYCVTAQSDGHRSEQVSSAGLVLYYDVLKVVAGACTLCQGLSFGPDGRSKTATGGVGALLFWTDTRPAAAVVGGLFNSGMVRGSSLPSDGGSRCW